MLACHARGHGFKSRIRRHIYEVGVNGSTAVSKTVNNGSTPLPHAKKTLTATCLMKHPITTSIVSPPPLSFPFPYKCLVLYWRSSEEEQMTLNHKVVGSIPTASTKLFYGY